MAKEDQKPTSEERVDTVIHQQDGTQLRIGFSNREYEDGETDRTEKETEYLETPDGHLWGPHLLMKHGAKGGLVVCEACRRRSQSFFERQRPRMIWTTMVSARRCHRCGRWYCSRDYTLSNDKHIRCRRCDRLHRFYDMLMRVFFKEA